LGSEERNRQNMHKREDWEVKRETVRTGQIEKIGK